MNQTIMGMQKLLVLFLFIVTSLSLFATGRVTTPIVATEYIACGDTSVVYDIVEEMPQFPGGDAAVYQYLKENIKYPKSARKNDIQGRVRVGFVVDTDGSVTDVKVISGIDPVLDNEAIRVVSSMPKWIPGRRNGKAVKVKYFMPVTFRIF